MAEEQSDTQKKLCWLCSRPIAPARLEALPGVTTCIECAKKYPRKIDTSGIELSQASPINRNGFAPKD
jgi:RNA polymerase-binding transcription factor DksA